MWLLVEKPGYVTQSNASNYFSEGEVTRLHIIIIVVIA